MWDDKSVKWKLLSRVRLFVTPMDYSPPGSSVHGILQAKILEWIAVLFSRESPQPRDATQVSFIAGRFFTSWATRCVTYLALMCISVSNYHFVYFKCIQSCVCVCVCVCTCSGITHLLCPTLCDPMDCSPPGSFVHRILQARILEWVAIPFCNRSSWPRDQTRVSRIASKLLVDWASRKLCSVLSNSLRLMDCRLPGSSVLGIFQARILERVAISFSSIQLYLSIIPQ